MSIWHKPGEIPRKGSSIVMMQRNNGLIVGHIDDDPCTVIEYQRREVLRHQLATCELWAYVDDLANDARASIGLAEMVRLDQEMGLYGQPNPMRKAGK